MIILHFDLVSLIRTLISLVTGLYDWFVGIKSCIIR